MVVFGDGDDVGIGVDLKQACFECFDLGHAECGARGGQLAVEVRGLDGIAIYKGEMSETGTNKCLRGIRTYPTDPKEDHARRAQLFHRLFAQ